MNLLNRSINFILLFILLIIIIFSSVSFYNYLSYIEQKNYLEAKLQYYKNQKLELEKIIKQIKKKESLNSLKILLLKKKKNEKFVFFNNKNEIPEYKVLKDKNIYIIIYILISSLLYLIILQDFLQNSLKNNEEYKYNFKYYKGAKEKLN